jgi:hypothetical protein
MKLRVHPILSKDNLKDLKNIEMKLLKGVRIRLLHDKRR